MAKYNGHDSTPVEMSEVAQRAYRKLVDGKKDELTEAERAALKAYEKEKEERLRWKFYESIPQKHWRRMSGRQTKVINEQAERYKIPFGGATISLSAVARAIHDFLAERKYKLARDDDVMLSGPASPALERFREERASLARLDRLDREGELLPRDVTRQSLAKIAAILRIAGETLERQFGPEAANILHAALDDAEFEINRFFSQPEPEGEPDAPD